MRSILHFLILLALALASCGQRGASPPAPASSPTLLPTPALASSPTSLPTPTSDPSRPPVIQLSDGSTIYDGVEGSYCWNSSGRALCVDKVFPPFSSFVPWPKGQVMEILINGPAPTELSLQVLTENKSPMLNETLSAGTVVTWTPSVSAGNYILAVFARWPEGDVVYFFPVAFAGNGPWAFALSRYEHF